MEAAMVTSKTFERLTRISPKIAFEAGTSEEVVKKVLAAAQTDVISRRRQPALPPPEGGISLMDAQRKYKIDHTLLSRWRKRKIIETILVTRNEVYVSEESVKKAAGVYTPGRGKRDVVKSLSPNSSE
jgi:hypothetical protein